MRHAPIGVILLLAASLAACTARAQAVTVEPELPALDPPPPPPRIVAAHQEEAEVEPVPVPPAAEKPATPTRPAARPARPENRVDPPVDPPRVETGKPAVPPLVLAPKPGSEGQTETAIRNLLTRVTRDLSRVNVATLGADGKAQFETAQRFLQQAEEALKGHNLVFASKLADKASTLASVFVR